MGEGMWACSVLRVLPDAKKMRIGAVMIGNVETAGSSFANDAIR